MDSMRIMNLMEILDQLKRLKADGVITETQHDTARQKVKAEIKNELGL